MARIDRLKRSVGTAVRRKEPSRAAQWLVAAGLVHRRVLDYGCGIDLDADTFGWDSFDPAYRPREPIGPYDTIMCTLVLNVLSRTNRTRVLQRIQNLLAPEGVAYLAVARNLPLTGKLGIQHCLQNYVVLSLPIVYEDAQLAIYALRQPDVVEDRTGDLLTRRDARRSNASPRSTRRA